MSKMLGPHMIADTGQWGTWAWREFLLGVPGFRLGGGTDEIQRNILAERVLRLPKDPPAAGPSPAGIPRQHRRYLGQTPGGQTQTMAWGL